MKHDYPDLMAFASAKPLWWDENGVPRFWAHAPKLCPNIYAKEIVLLEVACAACDQVFDVQMSRSHMDDVRASLMNREPVSLEQQVMGGSIHYGDPPRHGVEHLCSGETMNCHDLRVKEFWKRDTEWARVPELEVSLVGSLSCADCGADLPTENGLYDDSQSIVCGDCGSSNLISIDEDHGPYVSFYICKHGNTDAIACDKCEIEQGGGVGESGG